MGQMGRSGRPVAAGDDTPRHNQDGWLPVGRLRSPSGVARSCEFPWCYPGWVPSLFTPIVPEAALHPSFKVLLHPYAHAPTREVMDEVFCSMPNPDGTFISDFQTTGFNARVWELYLYAWGSRSGHYDVYRPHDRPDFRFSNANLRTAWIEAVTAAPAPPGVAPAVPPDSDPGFLDALRYRNYHFVPQRLGSPLFSKLQKRYWELEWVRGLPFVLAIADFHDPSPYRNASSILSHYLYGVDEVILSAPLAPLRRALRGLPDHRVGDKVVPAGFFKQPDAENVSAVVFSSSGTIAKFSRMGYDSRRHAFVKMIRFGLHLDYDPDAVVPRGFAYVVGDGSHAETWGEGVEVFHNPHAKLPLPLDFFPDAAVHQLGTDRIESTATGFQPFFSITHKAFEKHGRPLDTAPFERMALAIERGLDRDGPAAEPFIRELLKPAQG